MEIQFSDHFTAVSVSYADFRPRYPAALFEWLSSIVSGHSLAWDCATGSGQASCDLVKHFDRVVATDASQAQIQAAALHPGIQYRVAHANESGLPDASVDLVTVAQALHWFDFDSFFKEVRRVLKPGGILAVWTYGTLTVEGDNVNNLVQKFYYDVIGPYWPPERKHVESGYQDLPFPFTEIPAPLFEMTAEWSLKSLLGYIHSWSATSQYFKQNGVDPVIELATELAPVWGSTIRKVVWPLAVRVGRV